VRVSARRGFSAYPPGFRPASPLTRLEGITIKKKKQKKKKRKKKKKKQVEHGSFPWKL
jgi:hypothetical protein